MATNAPAGMTVLPQYQGDYYTLQNKQALAQALMQQSLQPQQIQATGSGPYTVMPKYSIGGGLAQLGQALLAAKTQQQASQGLQALGQAQWSSLAGSPQSSGVGGSADGAQQTGTVANPFQADPQALAGALASSGGGGAAPQAPQQSGGGMLAPGSALNPSGMDSGKAAYLYMTMGPTEYAKNFVAPYVKPTDATLMARQAGADPRAANAGALLKANNLPMNTYAPNTVLQDPRTNQFSVTPSAAPEGSQTVLTPNGPQVVPIPGALSAMQGASAANAAGAAQFKPVQVYNPRTQQMEYSSEAAVTNPQGGAAPTLPSIFAQQESSGGKTAPDNPLQIQKGTFDQFAKPGESWANPADKTAVAQRVLANYSQQYNGDLGRVATAYFSGPGNVAPAGSPTPFIKNTQDANGKTVASYVGDILGRAGGAGFGGSGASAAAPPLGAQTEAEGQANAQIDTMKKSYQNLQTVRSGAPAALQDVDNMSKLAQGASPLTIGPAGAKFAGLFSANAAEYEKSRDNLVTNLGSQLGINSDAARDLVYGSIPSYGAPKQAVQNGLSTLRGQIQTRLLKSDYLSGAFTVGDAKAYNQKENQFDQQITPAVANLVSMPSGPDRAAALQQAAGNPQLRARLEWAAQNGVLK